MASKKWYSAMFKFIANTQDVVQYDPRVEKDINDY